MSFWSTLTMHIDYSDDRVDTEHKELQEKALQYVEKNGGRATSYINHLRDVWIKPYGVDTEKMMKELSEHWSRAVIIRANNTSDVGTATLYEKEYDVGSNGNVWPRDKYTEMQKDDGVFTGRKAAAYMMFTHGIDCDPNHRMKWTDSEEKVGWSDDE